MASINIGNTTSGSTANSVTDKVNVEGAILVVNGAVVSASNPLPVTGGTGGGASSGNNSVSATNSVGGISTIFRLPSCGANNNAQNIKNSAGRVMKIRAYNTSGAALRLKFYNVTTTPVPGTTAIFDSFPMVPGVNSYDMADIGWYFSTGISIALVTGPDDANTTVVAAAALTDLSISYV